uniref:Uncharacterized protein n=1 Tax=Nelumbo nucifera TaxID=4432 RepID=A0A822YHI3_NELNU|nr:TPA_asm: hypothetical protein HUJ06_009782 [Nelumbo nucifera]
MNLRTTEQFNLSQIAEPLQGDVQIQDQIKQKKELKNNFSASDRIPT